tara:strand:- start:6904 stop:7119 length:216 start_codon:yes stop_codon:yes gene_type:complete
MALSRQHYEAIAEILSYQLEEVGRYEVGSDEAICDVTGELSRYFLQDNPRFSKVKFITAVGCENIIKTGDL